MHVSIHFLLMLYVQDGNIMAVKVISNSVLSRNYVKFKENLEREVNIMKKLKSSKNVIEIFMAGVSGALREIVNLISESL